MNLVRCDNGHFYDNDQYAQCPHCGAEYRDTDVTVALTQSAPSQDSVTASFADVSKKGPVSLAEAVQQATTGGSVSADDSVTVGYYDKSMGIEPVVGWLVCVEGNNLGKDFRLKAGRNFIGRAASMDVSVLGDETVSREKHAVVVYEPKAHIFLAQPGESKELFYLNDQVVLAAQELKLNDILGIGDTKLMFVPCVGKAFNWDMVDKEES